MADVKLIIRDTGAVSFTITEDAPVVFKVSEGGAPPPYTGDYDVTPDFTGRTLPTEGKTMTDDVTVRAIPVSRTTNPQGGKTVYIGEI